MGRKGSRGRRRRGGPCWGMALGLWCVLWLCGQPAGAASAARTVISGRYHYTISYPVTWHTLRVAGATFAATAANHNAVVAITTEPGRADTTMLRKAVILAFAPFGSALRAPALSRIHLRGASGILARGLVSTSRGIQRSVEAVAVSRLGRLYIVLGVVIDARARTAPSDVRVVHEIIAGMRFF